MNSLMSRARQPLGDLGEKLTSSNSAALYGPSRTCTVDSSLRTNGGSRLTMTAAGANAPVGSHATQPMP